MRRRVITMTAAALIAVASVAALAAPAQDNARDAALEARVQTLSAELRCLVCQNQSLADSHAELALDLKNQVREQLQAGRSEAQVIAYMTERYGDFVLYRPPFKAATALLWAGPALLALAGIGLLARAVRRHARAADEEAELGAADRERAEALLAPREPTRPA